MRFFISFENCTHFNLYVPTLLFLIKAQSYVAVVVTVSIETSCLGCTLRPSSLV